jgi:DNA-binding NarL/FixJ family response regulator
MINLLLVDDQTLVRQGIKSLLSLSEKLNVVAEASDGATLNKKGFSIPVIMLTTFDDHESVLQALQTGAKGYLLKDVSLETLVNAIETVYQGKTLIQPAITEKLLEGLRGVNGQFEASDIPEPLTEREIEILRLLAAGCSNREMSQSLFKSEGTIKNQVSSILSKLGVRDRTRAVLKSIELGLI